MTTHLARQIAARLKAKNLSINMLEKEAGLKSRAVQNIMRGKSKKPSAELLRAIAGILDCSIEDLLGNEVFFNNETPLKSRTDILFNKYENPEVLTEALNSINRKLKGKDHLINAQQVIDCLTETYVHALQKTPHSIDEEFIDWYISLIIK